MKPNQQKALEKINSIYNDPTKYNGVVLALDPGDGKTLTWLTFGIQHGKDRPRMLVVSESSPIDDWKKECEKHFSPPLSAIAIGSRNNGRADAHMTPWWELDKYNLVLINYDMMAQGYAMVVEKRRQILEQAILNIDSKFPSTRDTAALTDDLLVEHQEARQRRALLQEFLVNHAEKPDMLTPIPDEELAMMETVNACTTALMAIFYHTWDTVGFDEADKARTPETNCFNACVQIKSKFYGVITGTPFNNRLSDMQSMFLLAHIQPEQGKQWSDYSGNKEEYCRLFTEIRDNYLIHTSGGGLSTARYQSCEIYIRESFRTPIEKVLYEQILTTSVANVRSGKSNMLDGITRLRQACDGIYDSTIYPDEPRFTKNLNFLDDNKVELKSGMPTKVRMLLAILPTLIQRKEKGVVYVAFKHSITQIIRHVTAAMPDVRLFVATGDTTCEERLNVRHRFDRYEGVALLLTVDIFDSGVNIQAANHVVHWDNWWNPVKKAQRTFRVARLDQTRSIFIWNFMIANSVEESIYIVGHTKSQFSRKALTETITVDLVQHITSKNALLLVQDGGGGAAKEVMNLIKHSKDNPEYMSTLLRGKTIEETIQSECDVYIVDSQDRTSWLHLIPATQALKYAEDKKEQELLSSSSKETNIDPFAVYSAQVKPRILKRPLHHLQLTPAALSLRKSSIPVEGRRRIIVLEESESLKRPRCV